MLVTSALHGQNDTTPLCCLRRPHKGVRLDKCSENAYLGPRCTVRSAGVCRFGTTRSCRHAFSPLQVGEVRSCPESVGQRARRALSASCQ